MFICGKYIQTYELQMLQFTDFTTIHGTLYFTGNMCKTNRVQVFAYRV